MAKIQQGLKGLSKGRNVIFEFEYAPTILIEVSVETSLRYFIFVGNYNFTNVLKRNDTNSRSCSVLSIRRTQTLIFSNNEIDFRKRDSGKTTPRERIETSRYIIRGILDVQRVSRGKTAATIFEVAGGIGNRFV